MAKSICYDIRPECEDAWAGLLDQGGIVVEMDDDAHELIDHVTTFVGTFKTQIGNFRAIVVLQPDELYAMLIAPHELRTGERREAELQAILDPILLRLRPIEVNR